MHSLARTRSWSKMLSLYRQIIRTPVLQSSPYRDAHLGCCIRLCSNLPDASTSGSGLPPSRKLDLPFPTIYDKFPHALQCYKYYGISYLASLCTLKKLLIPFSVFVVSSAIMAEINEIVSREFVEVAALTTTALVFAHFSVTLPLRNFVGFFYIDQETQESIVSFIDFWGNRIDTKFEPGDLYFQAHGNVLDKLYIFLISRKTGQKFRINVRYADVFSQELLEQAVSKIPDNAF